MNSTPTIHATPSFSDVADSMRTLAPSVNERLSHLFRASLKNGRIHPLYLPILKYRHSRAGA